MTETQGSSSGPLRGPLRKRESSLWPREEHDWYQEPRWVSQRLFEAEGFRGSVWDPAAGGGNIVLEAMAAGFTTLASDIVVRSLGLGVRNHNFLERDPFFPNIHNIVSNPPFKLCDDRKGSTHPWVEQCLRLASRKVALLLPANWIQGDRRSRWLEGTPLRRVWFISPRPAMPPGQVVAAGQKTGAGTTDYAWFVWQQDYDGPAEIRWLRRDP